MFHHRTGASHTFALGCVLVHFAHKFGKFSPGRIYAGSIEQRNIVTGFLTVALGTVSMKGMQMYMEYLRSYLRHEIQKDDLEFLVP